MMTPAPKVDHNVRLTWRFALDSSMLIALSGLIFWCGQMSQQMTDFKRVSTLADELMERTAKMEARQELFVEDFNQIDHRLERIEDTQKRILTEVAK